MKIIASPSVLSEIWESQGNRAMEIMDDLVKNKVEMIVKRLLI